MSNGRPRSHSDETILEAIDELVDAGERDLWKGGVRPERVADALDIPPSTAEDRITTLVEEGDLVKVDGAAPDGYHPRVSYLPADHQDVQPPEY